MPLQPASHGTGAVGVSRWLIALAIAVFAAVALQTDLAEDHPLLLDGPGLTLDEGFNVEVGVYLVQSIGAAGLSILHPATLLEIFSHPDYNADHPPWGRLLLGLSEQLGRSLLGPRVGPPSYVLTYARFAPAAAFALTVWLVGWMGTRLGGRTAGLYAACALACMPRAFGHAHLASLETFMSLTFAAVLFVVAANWSGRSTLSWRDGLWPGMLLGLAFLTKMQAIFLPPILIVWGLWNWRVRAASALACLLITAGLVFLLGWPWLWTDPLQHAREYFARTTERQVIYCQYLGIRYADREVPWHYAPVMFCLTMPLATLVLGLWGHFASNGAAEQREVSLWTDPARQLIACGWCGPIVFFMLPGITVYDGIRLFLVSLPCFAVFVGLGAMQLQEWLDQRFSQRWITGLPALLLAIPLLAIWQLNPCWLSYYSEGIGGLPGAQRLGMDINYWGDAVTAEMLRKATSELPPDATLDVAPVLHPSTLSFFMPQQTVLRTRPDLRLRGYDPSLHPDIRYVLYFRRLADPWPELDQPDPARKSLLTVRRQGVVLAELLELPEAAREHAVLSNE